MARSIPKGFSGVLEELELERPQLVTTSQLASLCERSGIRTPAKVVASRLREKGWLLATPQRGVWEFAPAELAGPYSSADPLLPSRLTPPHILMTGSPSPPRLQYGHSA